MRKKTVSTRKIILNIDSGSAYCYDPGVFYDHGLSKSLVCTDSIWKGKG